MTEASQDLDSLYLTRKLNRVVVTGMGAVTPLGLNMEDTWQGLVKGRSGIERISGRVVDGKETDRMNSEVDIAGLIKGIDATQYFPQTELKLLRRMHESAQYSLVASIEALTQAGLLENPYLFSKGKNPLINVEPERIGASIGTGIGGGSVIADVENTINSRGDQKIPPPSILKILAERVATVPSICLNLQAEVVETTAACATGAAAIINATRILMLGEADVMLAGGAEKSVHEVAIGSFNQIHALSHQNDSPEQASRPFDQDADGFVMSDGAGIMVLETLEHALKRNAPILAEIIGYANTSDAEDETLPNRIGAVRAIRLALERAAISPSEIDYINAHATSTGEEGGDGPELDALQEVFGEDLKNIPVSATKSMTGHLMGAAGSVEAEICIEAIQKGLVPPTINLYHPIRKGLNLVPNKAQEVDVEIAMSNSFGFGGLNTVLIFRRYQSDLEQIVA